MECDALKILVQVLDSSNNSNSNSSCSNSSSSSSSADHDSLIKYVPLSLKLLAAALGVRNPNNDTERTPDCDDKLHEHLDETSAGSDTVHSTTEVSKVAGNKSIGNEHGSFFCVILHVLLKLGNACYYSVQNLLSSSLLSKKL